MGSEMCIRDRGASVLATMWLAWTRKWSINTFDGAAVARFDVEGYAKPHIRAQAYLAGMLMGMTIQDSSPLTIRTTWKTHMAMLLALVMLLTISFVTITGAYSRRACRYEEWPSQSECGSTWTMTQTFLYAATSRAIWSLAVCIMMYLCLQGAGGAINQFLSLLSLIHI